MSDPAAPTDPANAPADPPQTDPPADPPAAATPPSDPPAGQPKLEDLPPEVQRLIQNQRDAERREKARADAAEAKVRDAEREKMDAKERAELEAKEAREAAEKATREANEARLQVALSRAEIKRTVTDDKGEEKQVTLRVADPELAGDALLKQGVEFNDDGTIKDFEERVTRLLAERPILAKGETPAPPQRDAPRPNGGPGGTGGETPPQLTAEEVQAANDAGMTPEAFASWKSMGSLEDFERMQAERQAAT